MISEYGRTSRIFRDPTQLLLQSVSVKNIVTQNQRDRIIGNELLANNECLRQTAGLRLHRIGYRNSPLTTVAQ